MYITNSITMKIIVTLTLLAFLLNVSGQEASVERSTYGIQTGFLGTWVHNELRITNSIALRSELGLDFNFWGGDFVKDGYLLTPVLTLEPRFYYNLEKRESKSRKIINNTGSFLSLRTSYHPDWFNFSNYDNISVIPDLSIIPSWGIKTHIGKHFCFEGGLGYRLRTTFTKSMGYSRNINDDELDIHFRIGYSF